MTADLPARVAELERFTAEHERRLDEHDEILGQSPDPAQKREGRGLLGGWHDLATEIRGLTTELRADREALRLEREARDRREANRDRLLRWIGAIVGIAVGLIAIGAAIAKALGKG